MAVAERLGVDIVYEDDSLLVVSKPSGLVTTRSLSYRGETLEDRLRAYFDLKGEGVGERAGITHRLDKDASGLLIVAKNEVSFRAIQHQFKTRKVKKKYWALVYGEVHPSKGRIEAPLIRNPKDRRKFTVSYSGKHAVTTYVLKSLLEGRGLVRSRDLSERLSLGREALKRLASERFSLLEVRPLTGRTHQIRVHFLYLGHPLVGDSLYSGRRRYHRDRAWCPRLFLHAFFLGFFHPETGEWREFELKLTEELREVLRRLECKISAHD